MSNPVVSDPINVGSVVLSYGSTGAATGATYLSPFGDEVEIYDGEGHLVSITNRAGLTQTISYVNVNGLYYISKVTDPFGRSLTLTYNAQNDIATMTDPAGGLYQYSYNSDGMLASVTYPDGKVRTYVYNEPAYTSNTSQAASLTGIVDENGNRYATFGYDGAGTAIMTEHAGGVDQYNVSVNSALTFVTDPLGTSRGYSYKNVSGLLQVSGVSIPPCPACGPAGETYDTNGFPSSITDYNGNVTTEVYDTRGLEDSRTEAFGTAQARTITTTWLPNFRLPSQIVEPLRTTNFSYDGLGNLLSKTITAGAETRTWQYTYNSNGEVLTADGPRTDVADITTNAYDGQGNLTSVTNALGQTTTIGPYDANGRPLRMTDPNGLVTQLAYDPRGRLVSRNAGGELTTYTYDGVGQLIKVTLPDGSYLQYTYDPAHRLTGINDALGNSIAYTLDAMGNRIQENVYDPTSTLAQTRSRLYNTDNRLIRDIGAANQLTLYAYDNQGNVTRVTDPLGQQTNNAYDPLNRLINVTDPLSGLVNYAYDSLDQLTQVTDQRSLATQYSIDGLGNVNQVTSPDTGITASTFDSAGNVLTRTDAKGQTASYTYDALNRVTSIAYSTDSTLNVSFTYDQGTNGVGRLTGLTDNTGSTSYGYEIHGRLTSENRLIGGVSYVTAYAYDNAGRLSSMTYPSGRQVVYARDGLGRINGITTTVNNVTQTVLTGVTYRPFGPEQVLAFGNGQTYTRSYDQDGRVASYTLPGQTLALAYDAASRITKITDPNNASNTTSIGYDSLDRLTGFTPPSGAANQSFIYDAVGNRTRQTIALQTYPATYATTSNQIAAVAGPAPKTYRLDANGSIVSDTFNTFAYDARGRMNQVTTTAGTSQYLVNAMGQRVQKTVAGSGTVFHYDAGGRLIAESDTSGTVKVEYIYLNDIPLAVFK